VGLALALFHHADQGVQYASGEYTDDLKSQGVEISLARTGNSHENAVMESFFNTLKYEEACLYDYQTLEDVVSRLPYCIEEVYNPKRLHSAPDYRSPNDSERLPSTQENMGVSPPDSPNPTCPVIGVHCRRPRLRTGTAASTNCSKEFMAFWAPNTKLESISWRLKSMSVLAPTVGSMTFAPRV
jgi:hypothetical protein